MKRDEDQGALRAIGAHLSAGGQVVLLLDYDGTLVPYAATPDEARPDDQLIRLLTGLGATASIRTAILSGRTLAFLQSVFPVPGLILAGLYGLEIRMSDGVERRIDREHLRPEIEKVKAEWTRMIAGKRGFLVEDKGIAVALHGRLADPVQGAMLLRQAQATAPLASGEFRLVGGDRYIEVAPTGARKDHGVRWILAHLNLANALAVCVGDDENDEAAFQAVRERGGIAIVVGSAQPDTAASVRVADTAAVRAWLASVLGMAR